ncbi:hypothetical protein SK571_37015 [Lentzea sp. BCCO 10_0798]|uniref:PH domain-containing protein n=1 Tax=Lentzea kristufekii TaxID=3095430 RepID=A0ABU4U3M9_9PSEU|nr:hypothetical protein [Lentzea sp. BCCO 10_0798]MDX8055005.1 hypothetical protein [Lentzea sp. BCCO 10_0798]
MQSTHTVPADRRRVLGVVMSIMALACAALTAAGFVVDLGGAEDGLVFAVIPLLLFAPSAVLLLSTPGKPELIELDDDGIAHVLGGVKRSWAWDQVAALDINEPQEYSYDGSSCTVRFTDGQLLHVSGRTENSRAIVAALTTHGADAQREPVRKKHKRRAAAVLGGITLVCGSVATWAIVAQKSGEPLELAQPAVACATPAVISLILLVSVLVTGRR